MLGRPRRVDTSVADPKQSARQLAVNVLLFFAIAALYLAMGGLFEGRAPVQRALYELACILWLAGGMVLMRVNRVRVQQAGGPRVRSLVLPFLYFNKKEWLALGALFLVVAALSIAGAMLETR